MNYYGDYMLKNIILFCTCVVLFTLCVQAEPTKVITLEDKNTIVFNQAFRGNYVSKKQMEFMEKVVKLGPKDPIYLVLNTPGGSVKAGNMFIDTLRAYPNPVHTITIFAASMGYNLVQAMDRRYILPTGELMSHKATIRGLGGTLKGSAESLLNFYVSMVDQLDKQAAKRVGITLEEYEQLVAPDYWVTGVNAVKANHADEIVYIICSESMLGEVTETVRTPFGKIRATFSKCPLITAPISIQTRNFEEHKKVYDFLNNKRERIGYEL